MYVLLYVSGLNVDNMSTASHCEHCHVRQMMQQKYLGEAHELYDEFFHIVQLPLLTEEVRGPEKLKDFSRMLVEPYVSDLD
jgi:arsenite-transporting ATPase